MNILDLNNKLMLGSLLYSAEDFPTFSKVKSVFTYNLYNFIIPKVNLDESLFTQTEKVRADEIEKGFDFSYYLKKDKSHSIQKDFLESKGFSLVLEDCYLVLKLEKSFDFDTDFEFRLVESQSDFDEFLDISRVCFPDWDSNDEFCKVLADAQNSDQSSKAANYIITKNNQSVAIASILYSSELNIAYFTNMGTLPEFRGLGIQKTSIKHLCNELLKNKISRMYAIVESGCISYHNFEKLGFEKLAQYDVLFSS